MSDDKTKQPQVVQCPEKVEISGQLAMQLKEYIGSNPCPSLPVNVAISMYGGLEMALQAAAAGENKPATGQVTDKQILEEAKKQAEEAREEAE